MTRLLPRVVGHRGAAATAPENTLEGMKAAAALGVRAVEFDTKLTADGVVVLMHDDTLERTTDGKGAVADTAFAALRALDAGAWFGAAWRGVRVPTLAETIDLLAALGLQANIEIKPSPGREAETALAVVATVRRCWPAGRPPPLLSSFRLESLLAAQAAAPELPRGLLVWETPPGWAEDAAAAGCAAVHCAEQYLTLGWAAQIREAGYGLAVYTVNDPVRAVTLWQWGADAVISDLPGAILAVA